MKATVTIRKHIDKERLVKEFDDELIDEIREKIIRRARQLVPVDTGKLQASIRMLGKYSVGSTVRCANDSGQTVIEFNGYGTDKKLLFDAMDTLRKNILQARNALVNYELWYIKASGVVGYATEDVRIYRYSFDIETQWRDK
jgi:hypothetical protein